MKKHSIAPNGFIEDFFKIVNEKYDDKELSIDFNNVVKWLDVRKDHLKRLIVKHFIEKFDYMITKRKQINKNGPGANYVEDIVITPDCFKELCMLSQTPRAKEVRLYYLSIEKLIRKYYHYIQEGLRKKINALETNQKPKANIKRGIIYFFKALNQIKLDDELENEIEYKIGKTKNKQNRFNNYNSGNSNDIEPLFILEIDDIDRIEKCIKNLINEYQTRKHKEIYKINIDILKSAFVKCDELVSGFKKYIKDDDSKKVYKNFKKMRNSEHGILLTFRKSNFI